MKTRRLSENSDRCEGLAILGKYSGHLRRIACYLTKLNVRFNKIDESAVDQPVLGHAPRHLVAFLCTALLWLPLHSSAKNLEMSVEVVDVDEIEDDHEPMFVIWLAKGKRGKEFVKTLVLISEDEEYYPDLTAWFSQSQAAGEDIDAFTSATLNYAETGQYQLDTGLSDQQWDSGDYVLRIESSVWDGRHHKGRLLVPLDGKTNGLKINAKRKSHFDSVSFSH